MKHWNLARYHCKTKFENALHITFETNPQANAKQEELDLAPTFF